VPLALQRLLGHTSAKVTVDAYSDLFDDDLDASLRLWITGIHLKLGPKCGHKTLRRKAAPS
jgi:hypothetical protein